MLARHDAYTAPMTTRDDNGDGNYEDGALTKPVLGRHDAHTGFAETMCDETTTTMTMSLCLRENVTYTAHGRRRRRQEDCEDSGRIETRKHVAPVLSRDDAYTAKTDDEMTTAPTMMTKTSLCLREMIHIQDLSTTMTDKTGCSVHAARRCCLCLRVMIAHTACAKTATNT